MTRPPARGTAWLAALLTLAGCSTATVDVGYPQSGVNRALLGSAAPRRVVVRPVSDRRAVKERIGARPEDGKPLVTSRPVTDIVREALVVEIVRNGHEVVDGAGEVVVSADVEEFWLDAVGRSAATRYVGKVAIAVVTTGVGAAEPRAARRYVGIARRTADAESADAWRDAMATALARAMHDAATDPELALAFGHPPR